MKIVISSGHGKYIRGASGYPVPPQLDEVDEARRVVEKVAEFWRESGVQVVTFHDDTSHDQSTNLSTIVNAHNRETRDLDVSVHFNAYNGSAHGVEVLYVTQSSLASKVSAAIADIGFTNRGAKYRGDLYFLNNTEEPAILIETCFCDNTNDSNKYRTYFDVVCEAIAESISGIEVDGPQEPPPDEIEPPPDEVESDDNQVIIDSMITGDVTINVNGSRIVGHEGCEHVVDLQIRGVGDVALVVNGEAFHNKPAEPEEPAVMHKDIFATTFGGKEDNEYSSYPPYDSSGRGPYLDDTTYYVALPARIEEQPRVKVWNRATGRSEVGRLMDTGPWCTKDPYWDTGTRPQAEISWHNKTPLPDWTGTHAGEVAGNPAGIDLSPALFKALGMTDNGPVDWCFEEDAPAA